MVLRHPTHNVFEDPQQNRYYRVFCERTAFALSGFFDSDLWGRLILQACHQEPFVKHAVVALGALDKTMDIAEEVEQDLGRTGLPMVTLKRDGVNRVVEEHQFALLHYNKSIKLMRESTGGLDDDYHLRNVLISCLLIVCFEIFHGNMHAALRQAQIGINLLADWIRKYPFGTRGLAVSGLASPSPGIIDDELVQTFARLERQCVTFLKSGFQFERSKEIALGATESFQSMPGQFSTLKEARAYYVLVDRFDVHTTIVSLSSHSSSPNRTVYGQIPYRMFGGHKEGIPRQDEQIHYTKQKPPEGLRKIFEMNQIALSRWMSAFEPVLTRSRTPEGRCDYLGATILLMRLKSTTLASQRPLADEKTFHKAHLGDFIEIVGLAREVLTLASTGSSKRRTRFMFDTSTIGLLYFMTNFCRNRTVRRQAIALLEDFPGREGAWDSGMAARLARFQLEMEEQGIAGDEEHVPEVRRLVPVNLETTLSERKMEFSYFWPEENGVDGAKQELRYQKLTW